MLRFLLLLYIFHCNSLNYEKVVLQPKKLHVETNGNVTETLALKYGVHLAANGYMAPGGAVDLSGFIVVRANYFDNLNFFINDTKQLMHYDVKEQIEIFKLRWIQELARYKEEVKPIEHWVTGSDVQETRQKRAVFGIASLILGGVSLGYATTALGVATEAANEVKKIKTSLKIMNENVKKIANNQIFHHETLKKIVLNQKHMWAEMASVKNDLITMGNVLKQSQIMSDLKLRFSITYEQKRAAINRALYHAELTRDLVDAKDLLSELQRRFSYSLMEQSIYMRDHVQLYRLCKIYLAFVYPQEQLLVFRIAIPKVMINDDFRVLYSVSQTGMLDNGTFGTFDLPEFVTLPVNASKVEQIEYPSLADCTKRTNLYLCGELASNANFANIKCHLPPNTKRCSVRVYSMNKFQTFVRAVRSENGYIVVTNIENMIEFMPMKKPISKKVMKMMDFYPCPQKNGYLSFGSTVLPCGMSVFDGTPPQLPYVKMGLTETALKILDKMVVGSAPFQLNQLNDTIMELQNYDDVIYKMEDPLFALEEESTSTSTWIYSGIAIILFTVVSVVVIVIYCNRRQKNYVRSRFYRRPRPQDQAFDLNEYDVPQDPRLPIPYNIFY